MSETVKQLTARMKNLEILRLSNMHAQLEKIDTINYHDKTYKEHALYYITQMLCQRKRKYIIKEKEDEKITNISGT